jgi:hypothetical protein
MTTSSSCLVEPDIAAELDAARPRNRHVDVTVVLHDDFMPTLRSWERYEFFRRRVEDVLDRAAETLGEHSDHRAFVDGFSVDPVLGMVAVSARVRFIDALLAQPEVAECRNGYAFSSRDARPEATLG